mgnify:CR=1
MLREATLADMPELVRMGRAFHAAAKLDIEFDDSTFRDLCAQLIEADGALLLIDDGAMLAALCFPIYFNASALVAQELFWWVDPDKRGAGIRLLQRAEQWAKEKGAVTLQMIALDELSGESVGRLYERRGYRPLERSYVRNLNGH